MHDPARDPQVIVKRVDECETLDDLIRHCFPAFGGAFLRRVYTILDRAIGVGCPLTVSIAGPVTVSGQHQAWLIPLLEDGSKLELPVHVKSVRERVAEFMAVLEQRQ